MPELSETPQVARITRGTDRDGPGASRQRWRRRHWALLIAIVLLSRLAVFWVVFQSADSAPPDPNPTHWNRMETWACPLLRWDAGFYLEIAERGYAAGDYGGGATTAGFWPVYPLVVASLAGATGIDVATAAIAVSNSAFLLAVSA